MKQYSTDQMCRLCDVSRKQLRYYEERGILSPVARYEGNNYRYYTQEHIYEIVAAKALKSIDMPLTEMKDVIYGKNLGSIQISLQQQLNQARDNLENILRQYEQCAITYAKLAEALAFLKAPSTTEKAEVCEVVERAAQDVVSLSYQSTFEDEECCDIEYLPKLQQIAQEVNSFSFGSLLYLTYDHYDSERCVFNDQVHDFKIAAPVLDQKKPSLYYDRIPAFRGVSAIHIGSPKDKRLYRTYMNMLTWAKEQGYELENWSVEEWLISPMVTNNKNLWVIRVTIPIHSES